MTSFLLFTLGLALLYFGAEYMVEAAARIAQRIGISTLVLGLTVIAFGTSAPEFVISLLAALQGSPDIAVGNVVGSNTANIALVAGLTAILIPVVVSRDALTRDIPWMLAGLVLLFALAHTGQFSRAGGAILILYIAAYLSVILRSALKHRRGDTTRLDAVRKIHPAADTLLFLAGLAALVVGARLMVNAASEIARTLGVSELVIGVSIVAIGTSLPELATSIVAALKKEGAMSLGNILGSNIFNSGFVIGGVALITPIPVDPRAVSFDMPAMLIASVLLLPFVILNKRLGRVGGLLLVTLYVAYLIATFTLQPPVTP